MKKLSLSQKIILVLFLAVIFVYSFNQLDDSDTFYDLKTGQYILQTFSVPTHDIFSSSAAGALWVPHEWLAQIIFYLIYWAGGFLSLIIFAALLSVLTYFILLKLALEGGADFSVGVLFIFLLSYLTLELWVPRPQIFAYFSFALLIYFLEKYRSSSEKKFLVFAALTEWFWANINASFILGLVVIGFYFAAEFLKNRWPTLFGGGPVDSSSEITGKNCKNLGWLFPAAVALAFLTPAGYRGFLYTSYVQSTAYYLNVLEWKPITLFLYEIQAKIFLFILFLGDAFLVWKLWFKKESRDITWLGLALGISFLPFISIRHVAFWPLAVFVPLVVFLSAALKNFLERFSVKEIVIGLSVLGIILIVGRLFWIPKSFINEQLVPVAAADFIQQNDLHGPLFNLYNEGGYLIWRLWPQDKIFIDGRSEVYRGQPLLDFFAILNQHPGWENLVDEKYKLNYFFFASYDAPGIRASVEPLMISLLQKGFVLVYWNDDAIILARNIPENADIINKYGIKYANPFYDPAKIPASGDKAAAGEIKWLLARFPQSSVIQNYAREFLASH